MKYTLLCSFFWIFVSPDANSHSRICRGGVVTEEFLRSFPAECRNVRGNLVFNQASFDAAVKLGGCMSSVYSVHGRLVFEGINQTLRSPCLEELRVINNTEHGPAIELKGNNGLVSLNLKQLKKINNKDRRVFKVYHDNFLENASMFELSSLVKAAGGDYRHCLNLFEVRSINFVEEKRRVSALAWFFIIYGGVSALIYGTIIALHVFVQPHFPKEIGKNGAFLDS